MPMWLLLAVMSLATYRCTRLLVEDTFPPLLWLRDRLAGGWRPLTSTEERTLSMLPGDKLLERRRAWSVDVEGENRYVYRWKWVPQWIADLISCPFCASGWIALAVTAGTWATVGLPAPVLVWFSVWALGGLIAAQDWA